MLLAILFCSNPPTPTPSHTLSKNFSKENEDEPVTNVYKQLVAKKHVLKHDYYVLNVSVILLYP